MNQWSYVTLLRTVYSPMGEIILIKCSPCLAYRRVLVEPEALTTLSQLCDGDARSALNGLEMAVHAKRTTAAGLFCHQQKPTLTADGRTGLDSSTFNSQQASQHGQVSQHGQLSDLSSVTVTKSCQTESPDEGKVQGIITLQLAINNIILKITLKKCVQ